MTSKNRSQLKKVDQQDLTAHFPLSDVISSISQHLDARLKEGRNRGEVIGHNLEYGLGTENVVRALIREIMPIKYGVAKGKLINRSGEATRHLDVIIFDSLNCPTLYVDEHKNQILPIESAYAVIEVKSQTSSSVLQEAFENLASVAAVASFVPDCSLNEMLEYHPPHLSVLSFEDKRRLETICDNYLRLSQAFPRTFSFTRYSSKSPGFERNTRDFFLVSEINVIGKGSVYHTLDGRVAIGRWGSNTFGLFITSLLTELSDIKLPTFYPTSYLNWIRSGAREIYERQP